MIRAAPGPPGRSSEFWLRFMADLAKQYGRGREGGREREEGGRKRERERQSERDRDGDGDGGRGSDSDRKT